MANPNPDRSGLTPFRHGHNAAVAQRKSVQSRLRNEYAKYGHLTDEERHYQKAVDRLDKLKARFQRKWKVEYEDFLSFLNQDPLPTFGDIARHFDIPMDITIDILTESMVIGDRHKKLDARPLPPSRQAEEDAYFNAFISSLDDPD